MPMTPNYYLHLAVLGLTLAFGGRLLAQSSSPSSTVFMNIVGAKQGVIRGEVLQKGREGRHKLLAYSHEIVSPYDPASGMATGKRQHHPFRIVKLLNQAAPSLMTALTMGENLEIVVDVYTTDNVGAEIRMLTYTLTNARIVSIRPWMPNRSDASAASYPPAEEIAFTYQTITVTSATGGSTSTDDWAGAN
jgi:type VI secretion system secreted protein Hcp